MKGSVCITGADRGLGLSLVEQYLSQDYEVFAGRYMIYWHELDKMKGKYLDNLHIVEMDISSDASVKNAAARIGEKADRLDLLINSAGILGDISTTITDELDYEDMQRVFNTNALGALRVTNALIPLILRGSSRLIVNISSEAGSIAGCHRNSWFAYSMSKAALNMQAAIIHNQLFELGGQVLVIHPGWMQTYMSGEVNTAATYPPDIAAKHISELISGHGRFISEKPVFVDLFGNLMQW